MPYLHSVPTVSTVPIVPSVCRNSRVRTIGTTGTYILEPLELLERLEALKFSTRFAFTEIDFDDMRIFRYAGRRAFGDFFACAQDHNTMREIEQCPDDVFNQNHRQARALQLAYEIDRRCGLGGGEPRHELVE